MAKWNIPRNEGESDVEYRRRYHRERDRLVRLAKGLPVDPVKGLPCSEEGCERPSETKGLCGPCYRRKWAAERKGRTDLPEGRVQNPLYRVWFERKERGGLSPVWLDFEVFARDVGPRPSDYHYLDRARRYDPYGPDNFEWKEFVKRQPGETQKDFYARKWQAQKQRRPNMDVRRHLVRDFGINEATYEEMHAAQNGVCAICGEAEVSMHKGRGEPRSLAVDHCHKTNVVRDLLCWRCNPILGRVKESTDILASMIAYLEKWRDAPATAAALGRPARLKTSPHEVIIETQWGPMTASNAARRAGLKPGTVLSRLGKGWPVEDVLRPLLRPHRLSKQTESQTKEPI